MMSTARTKKGVEMRGDTWANMRGEGRGDDSASTVFVQWNSHGYHSVSSAFKVRKCIIQYQEGRAA